MVNTNRVWDGQRGSYLPLDIYTTKDEIVIRASVPGVNPDDVQITIEGSTVTIRGETKAQKEEQDTTHVLQEHGYGSFARTIDLAIPIQAGKAEAKFDNGVLRLTIPKAEEINPKVIKVKSA